MYIYMKKKFIYLLAWSSGRVRRVPSWASRCPAGRLTDPGR